MQKKKLHENYCKKSTHWTPMRDLEYDPLLENVGAKKCLAFA